MHEGMNMWSHAVEMAHQVKALAAKPDDLNSVLHPHGRKGGPGAGMVQWLRVHTAIWETQVRFLSSITATCDSSSRRYLKPLVHTHHLH